MVRRFIYLGVLAALLVGGDVAARGFVEAKVNQRARLEAPPGSTVSANVGGFPFVPPLVLGGRVSHAGVRVLNITTDTLVFAEVDVDLHGVRLDRGRLFGDRKARITSIDHGTIRAIVTQDALTSALHVPVKMASGVISLTVVGQDIPVVPKVNANGRLTLTGSLAHAFTLVIPATSYVPCVSDVTVLEGKMQLSCEIHEVPPALLDAVQSV